MYPGEVRRGRQAPRPGGWLPRQHREGPGGARRDESARTLCCWWLARRGHAVVTRSPEALPGFREQS